MKHKKIAAIITGGAIVGSLLLSGNAYAIETLGNTTQLNRQKTEISKKQKSSSRKTVSVPRFIGTIVATNGSIFTLTGSRSWNKHPFAFRGNGSTSNISTSTTTYTVNTSDSTVYMKNGKLDSLSDLTAGQRVMVNGTLDSTMSIINAVGINIVTK